MAQKVADFGFALYGAESYLKRAPALEEPLTSLAGHRMVSVEADRAAPGGIWVSQLDGAPDNFLSCSTLHLVASGVSGGLGLGIIPCIVGDSLPGVRRLTPPVDRFVVWIVANPEAKDNPRIRAVRDAVAQLIADESHLLAGLDEPPASAVVSHA
jgi:DNA-binding transcriptional LysR family regulator